MDHYTKLGIAQNANPEEIKKAYRKLASTHHPDKGGDTKQFQEIEEAYRILSNPETKAQYDNSRRVNHNPFNEMFQDFGVFTGVNSPHDIFQHIFKQANQRQHQQQNICRTFVAVSLEDAYFGKELTLKLQTPNFNKLVSINCPKGVQHGNVLRYENLIENTLLMVEFRINPNLKFDRNNNDLYSNVPISVLDLIAGTKIEFTTLGNKTLELNIPPKTQPFMQLQLQGHGMPIMNSKLFGDQIVVLKPFMPDKISDKVIEAINQNRI
jgi:DnaJ-class molecular chaperone